MAPDAIATILAQVLRSAAELKDVEIPDTVKKTVVTDTARAIAVSLIDNKPAAIFLGNLAQHQPQYADIHLLAQHIARITEASFGVLGEAANSVGAYLVGAVPGIDTVGLINGSHKVGMGGRNASQMLGLSDTPAADQCRSYLLMNLEPELDSYNPQQAMKALQGADLVVMMSAYKRMQPVSTMLMCCYRLRHSLRLQAHSSIPRDVRKASMGLLHRWVRHVQPGRFFGCWEI